MLKKILAILILPIFILSCSGSNEIKKIEKNSFLFGTYISITVYDSDEKLANKAIDMAFSEIKRVDDKFNSKVSGSILDDLNSGKVKEVTLDEEGVYLFENLKRVYNLSHGKYDVTIGPLLDVWDFGAKEERTLPSSEDLEAAKKKVDFSKLILDGNKLYFSEDGIEIDTGSFLKGYAVEKAKEVMREAGITSAFISSISSIETINSKPGKKPWRIGIENPVNTQELLGIIELNNKGMGVSGDYQTYVEIDGKKYHHIIDKTTGYPVTDKKMVVVISDNAFFSDMYSTAFFMMPIDEVLSFAKDKDLEVFIVDKDMQTFKSEGFNLLGK